MKKQTDPTPESRAKTVVITFSAMSVISPAIIGYGFYLAGFDWDTVKLGYLVCVPVTLVTVWIAYLRKMRQLKMARRQNSPENAAQNNSPKSSEH